MTRGRNLTLREDAPAQNFPSAFHKLAVESRSLQLNLERFVAKTG